MSTWTHINGCIRFDGLGIEGMPFNTELEVNETMGNTCDFESQESDWDACTVPCGSEGSLSYSVIRAGDGLVLWTAPIWGDLRDYEDVEEIEKWFNGIIYDEKTMIRSAILQVQVNGNTHVFEYEE